MTDDSLLVLTAQGSTLRCLFASTRVLVQEAALRHNTSPVATAALGRALTAGAIMSHSLSDDEQLTLQWVGDGPLGRIVVTADSSGAVRGYVTHPQVDVPVKAPGKLNVGQAVGSNGTLLVIKDLGMGQPYSGSVPLTSGEIAEDLARYFTESEQIPSVVNLGVLIDIDLSVGAAGGYIIQAMPGASDDALAKLERNIIASQTISAMLSSGLTPRQIAKEILSGLEYHELEEKQICYSCSCSKERLERALASLGRDDLEHIANSDSAVKVTCDFCRDSYEFEPEDIAALLKSNEHSVD